MNAPRRLYGARARLRYERVVADLEAFGALPIESAPPACIERMTRLLEARGRPDRAFRIVVVAGTCGKGSAAATLAALLQAAGYRTGLFTGPHLERWTERIRVNGRDLGADEFARRVGCALEAARAHATPARPERRASLVQVLALAACECFRDRGVEWAVMEAGIGGARDYTMALDPAACILTEVALDHTRLLGETVAEIAAEKAGIARPGVPLICSATAPEARAVVAERAGRAGAPLRLLGRDFHTEIQGRGFVFREADRTLGPFRLALAGAHQADNAAAAVAAFQALSLPDDLADVLRRGLARVRLPGRLERLRWRGREVLLDGAHQAAGARALRDALRQETAERPLVLLLGVLGDKDRRGMVDLLAPEADALILTHPPWEARAAPLDDMAAWAEAAAPGAAVRARASVEEAWQAACEAADRLGPRARVVVAGSLYLVGAVRGLISASKPWPLPPRCERSVPASGDGSSGAAP